MSPVDDHGLGFAVGQLVAQEHGSASPSGEGHRLIDFAEAERDGGWSLRSALVRFAQPEPVRASAVLELVRRTDAALGPSRNLLERDTVATDPDLGQASFAPDSGGRRPRRAVAALGRLTRRPTSPVSADAGPRSRPRRRAATPRWPRSTTCCSRSSTC